MDIENFPYETIISPLFLDINYLPHLHFYWFIFILKFLSGIRVMSEVEVIECYRRKIYADIFHIYLKS